MKGLEGKLTTSDKYLSAHLWELWQAMYGRHAQSVLLAGGLDVGDHPDAAATGMGGLTALLRQAQSEGQRREPPPPPAAPDHHPALTPEEQAISPLSVLLAQVRADSPDGRSATEHEVLTHLLGERRANELIGEDVIVVDASGAAIAPPPAKPAASQDKPLAETPASAAPSPAARGSPAGGTGTGGQAAAIYAAAGATASIFPATSPTDRLRRV